MYIAKILRACFISLFMLLLAVLQTMGQVKFTTIASSTTIGKSDYVEVEFVVENAQQIDQLTQPEFNHFRIVKGPIQSSGMSIINGAMSQYKAISFVLQPIKTGTFIVSGASATIDGKHMRSNSVTIQVSAAGTGRSNYQPMPQPVWPGEEIDIDREYVLKPGEDVNEKIRKNLFVKVQVSKTSCYVGEPIVATYKLYSRLQSESRVTKHPSLNGFSVYDMIDPSKDASSVETINGKPFTVHVIRKAQLIPLQSGTVDLDPVEIENTVHFLKGNGQQRPRSSNPLQELFDKVSGDEDPGSRIDQHITLESKPVEISIKALPLDNRPENFNGAVGNFSMDAHVDTREIYAEDAAVLKLTIKGTGNLPVVNAPPIAWPKGIESYAANAKEEVDKTVSPLSGAKSFEYKFVPSHAGSYTIPAVSFSFFDPAKGAYKLLEAGAMNFTVAPGKSNAAVSSRKADAEEVSKPTEEHGLMDDFSHFFQEHMEWFFAALILASLAIYLLVQNRLHRKSAEQAKLVAEPVAEVPVPIIPEDPFLHSKEFLYSGNYPAFYSALNRALWKVIGEKLQLPSSELNKQNAVTRLKMMGWTDASTAQLADVLNECEVKLYTPGYRETDLRRILNSAEELYKQLADL